MSRPSSFHSWTPDHYAPRPPAHDYPESSPQTVRLPPPSSLVAGAPGARAPPSLPSTRPVHSYQGSYVVSSAPRHSISAPHHSYAAPTLPSQHSSVAVDHSRRPRSELTRTSPNIATAPGERPDGPRFPPPPPPPLDRDRVAGAPPRPDAFSYHQHPLGVDMRADAHQHRHYIPPTPPPLAPAPTQHLPLIQERGRTHESPDTFQTTTETTSRVPPTDVNVTYKLNIRQQPFAARSCGFGERDRRVIDPPPIVELLIEGPNLSEEDVSHRLRYCHYVMTCSIFDDTGKRDASFMPEEYKQQRRLMGAVVGTPFVGSDEFNKEGCFFCFPDLSCRTPGAFRLNFSLVMIDPMRAREMVRFPVLVELMSDIFNVYNAKDFPGMQASTKLTKKLKEQGCIISIKKGIDKSKGSKGIDDISDGDEEDEEGESSQGKKRRRSSRR